MESEKKQSEIPDFFTKNYQSPSDNIPEGYNDNGYLS